MSKAIKVLIAEDQTLVRDALQQLLAMQPELDIVAAVADGVQAQEYLQQAEVDLVLTDIEMPNCDGLELCDWIHQHFPTTKTVILTTYNRAGYIHRALHAGAMGFVLKEVAVEELTQNIAAVAQGKRCYDPELVSASLNHQNPLTEREKATLILAEEGLSSAAIADKLCLSKGTVRNYLSECISKLYASSRIEAARIARDNGWL